MRLESKDDPDWKKYNTRDLKLEFEEKWLKNLKDSAVLKYSHVETNSNEQYDDTVFKPWDVIMRDEGGAQNWANVVASAEHCVLQEHVQSGPLED